MAHDDPNLPQLATIASALGALRERIVFVGGATSGILITDPLADPVRATYDVDAIVSVDSLPQFHAFEIDLATRGFERDIDSGVICRWMHKRSRISFDVMPATAMLGFGNRWYEHAVRSARAFSLPRRCDDPRHRRPGLHRDEVRGVL